MRNIVRTARLNPALRDLAVSLIAHVPGKDFLGEARALLNFVRANVRYTLDTNNVEVIQFPTITLQLGYGDCDDCVVLLQSLLECCGHQTRSVAVGFDPKEEGYTHVFAQVKLAAAGPWLSLDPTEPHGVGWAPPNVMWSMGCAT